jgi:hypothetical protein
MAHYLLARPLTAKSIDRAFPVAQAARMGLQLGQWRRFAAGRVRCRPAKGGIVTIENSARTILGLASYMIEPALGLDAICSAENFVAFDLLNNARVARALVRALEALALRQGATAIRIALPHQLAAMDVWAGPLCHSGLCADGILYFKSLMSENLSARRLLGS